MNGSDLGRCVPKDRRDGHLDNQKNSGSRYLEIQVLRILDVKMWDKDRDFCYCI